MDPMLLAELERRHRFESWSTPDPAQGSFLIWRYLLAGRELPGWRAHRIQRIESSDLPPAHLSIWQRADGRGRVLLSLDVWETATAAAARKLLIRLLAEFQSPLVERSDGIGDVGFGLPGEGAALFARGNLVVFLRNAGEETLALGDVARRFDENLRAQADDRLPREEAPRITRFEAAGPQPTAGQPVELRLGATPESTVWFKIFGPAGTLDGEGGQLRFTPATAGIQEIRAYAISQEGASASAALRLDVAPETG